MSPRDNWNRPVSRRDFLGAEGIGAAALVLGRTDALASTHEKPGYGHPLPDPGGLIDLPRGFQYRILSERGSTLSTGAPVPGEHDGMAAFRGPGKTTLLMRNHELGFMDGAEGSVVGKNPYDREERGGTIGVVVGTDHREISSFVTSSGTRNKTAPVVRRRGEPGSPVKKTARGATATSSRSTRKIPRPTFRGPRYGRWVSSPTRPLI